MRQGFIGRRRELAMLAKRLDRVANDGRGLAVAIRGRRQVGKSRLVQEFCDRAGVPYVYFAATKGMSPAESIGEFVDELRRSSACESPDAVPTPVSGSWPDAFRTLAGVLPRGPVVVVLDELPWLAEQDRSFDGALQTAWDRLLAARPVLLLLLGSDLHMMERVTSYDRPFHGRADTMILEPLDPGETARAVGLDGADALDARLVSGGLPGIVRSWPRGVPAADFLAQECADPAAAIFGVPESVLLAEFPVPDNARRVLEAVGSGDRTHANIAASAGGRQGSLPSGTLSPVLQRLVHDKRVLAMDEPLSARSTKPALYRVADTNLRLYLGVLRAAHELARRGRADAARRTVRTRWPSWRGRAVEPLVRDALERQALVGELPWDGVEAVGGWWNRRFDPELDLVGGDRRPVARHVSFVGSIKWLGSAFDRRDLQALRTGAPVVPGFDPASTGLVIVSLSGVRRGVDLSGVRLVWTAADVLAAWE